jgi:hypothetical protein
MSKAKWKREVQDRCTEPSQLAANIIRTLQAQIRCLKRERTKLRRENKKFLEQVAKEINRQFKEKTARAEHYTPKYPGIGRMWNVRRKG